MSNETPVLNICGLSRSFGDRVVIDTLNLIAEPGDRVAIRGANGSGKTTLLRCVLGTLLPNSGWISVSGYDAGSIPARAVIGASLAQERSFYFRLTGHENLRLFARLRGLHPLEANEQIALIVEELRLHAIASKRTDRCSTGELQQLGFARALLGSPSLLLLDEPTRSVDAEARTRLWSAINQRPAAVVLFASHLDEDLCHASRVLQLG